MSKDHNYNRMIQSKEWLKLRRWKLNCNPLCEDCEEQGILTSATEVHHITPVESANTVAGMEALMFNPGNLRALCHNCHVKVHAQEKSHTKEAVRERANNATKRFKEKFL